MMKHRQFPVCPNSLLVSKGGGTLDYVSDEGEVLMSVDVPGGMISAREYLAIKPFGAVLQARDGLVIVPPRSGYGVQPYGNGSHDSGANPDFVPTSATTMERQMRAQLMRMQAATDRLEKRAKALAKIDAVPRKAKPEAEPEVIEEGPKEKPKAKAEGADE
ncbi:MAG: hypothetical protein E6R08_06700 [Nevskiaceae bacterium]|nr:MAG: hypothetical protein E6R08_06700 [Nevskiaceae bacterium]